MGTELPSYKKMHYSSRWYQARTGRFHLLFGAGRQSVQLWRLEHNDRLLCGYSCGKYPTQAKLFNRKAPHIQTISHRTGSLSNAAPVGHLPESLAGTADLNLLRTDILLRDQRDRETVYRSAGIRAGFHLVFTAGRCHTRNRLDLVEEDHLIRTCSYLTAYLPDHNPAATITELL